MTEFPQTRASLLAEVRSPENRRAWDEFILLYRPAVYRMARRRGLQDADAQDVTQTVLVRIAAAIPRYESQPGIKFRHWLKKVARNAIFTALSQVPRDGAAGGTDVQEFLAAHPDAEDAIEQELIREYQRELFLRAAAVVRADVNEDTWQAFERTVIDGKPCEQVAAELGKSVGTVYAARSRIVKRLREHIQQTEEADV